MNSKSHLLLCFNRSANSHVRAIILLGTFVVCLQLHGAPDRAQNELLVKWKDGPENYAAAVGNAQIGSTVRRNFIAIGWQLVGLPPGMSARDGVEAYRQLDTVLAAEPNGAIETILPPKSHARDEEEIRNQAGVQGPPPPPRSFPTTPCSANNGT